jgi:hypothetical protein
VVWKSQPPSSNRFDRWNKELPKTADHKHRISIIKNLRERGISQEARKRGLHTSGNAEVEHIFMALKKSLPQNTQPEPHLSKLALCNPQQFLFAHMDQVLLSLVETRAVYLSTPLLPCEQEKQENENVNCTSLPIPYLAAALGVILEACGRTRRYHIHIRARQ